MEMVQVVLFAVVIIKLFPSCHFGTRQLSGLSNKERRNEIMSKIANQQMMMMMMQSRVEI